MRVISRKVLEAFIDRHPTARRSILAWYGLASQCRAGDLNDLKRTFATVGYGSAAVLRVFDVGGNHFRVIAGIHFNRQMLFFATCSRARRLRPLDSGKQTQMKAHSHLGRVPEFAKTWSVLQEQVFLKPIRSDEDYRKMVALANELADQLDSEEGPLADLFGVLSDLIEVWESHYPDLPKSEPKDVLRYLLDTHDLKQKDLADIASPTVISDILAGRRAISKSVAKALAERFGTDMSVFV